MLKRTLEISGSSAHIAVSHHQILLKRQGELLASFPSEDLGVVMVEHPGTTYSHPALVELARQNAVVVLCGPDHLPCSLVLPLIDHTQVVTRLRLQLAMSAPTKKRLWQQLVRAKILAQAANLNPDSATARKLRQYAASVRSNDADNREAVAARAYWASWLMEAPESAIEEVAFHRDPDQPGINALLNYGYAIVRAALARALVAAALHPAMGLHHSNRANAFCLADDLIEPLRPLVDATARRLAFAGEFELTQPVKAELLEVLNQEVVTGEVRGPLQVAMQRYVSSLVDVMEGSSKTLRIPLACSSAATAACG